jgi:ABC-type antimicrobial peptide transport system permease subunit
MIRLGLSYGLLSSKRRAKAMVLPIVTTATGAYLLVLVLSMMSGIKAQSASLGHGDEIQRAIVLIAVIVLLVGVVEVAVCTTRTVASRTRELGVLGATGVRRAPVVAALLVEPFISAVVGAAVGALAAVLTGQLFAATGMASSGISTSGTVMGVVIAISVSAVAAVSSSALPSWRAASRSPIRSLSTGG